MRIKLGCLVAVLLLSGCAFYGRDFSSAQVKNIQANVTSQREVFGMFGEPVQRGLESGYETWTYSYQHYSLGQGWRSKSLYVVFDPDGTVRNYSFTSN